MSTDNSIAKQRLYFGYGSNLWKEQMSKRCPTSVYCGIARLKGYQWIINKRGYANIIQSSDTKSDYTNEVWGLVYALDDVGEALLDLSEGVPESYTKEDLAVDFWPVKGDNKPNVKAEPQRTEMLAYIDRKRLEPSVPRREYIYRINMGVSDAIQEGIPEAYVESIIRKFVPNVQDYSATLTKLAQQQALFFDESADST